MVKNSDRESVIKDRLERQPQNVSLDDLDVWQILSVSPRRLDGIAEINGDYRAGSPRGYETRVPAFSATRFEDGLAANEFRSHGINPVKKLLAMNLLIKLIELEPLSTEVYSRGIVTA